MCNETGKKIPPTHQSWGYRVKTLAMTYSRMTKSHYHRRGCVSLPCSGWERVVPQRYDHQGEGGGSHQTLGFARSRSQQVTAKLDMDVVIERFVFTRVARIKQLEVI